MRETEHDWYLFLGRDAIWEMGYLAESRSAEMFCDGRPSPRFRGTHQEAERHLARWRQDPPYSAWVLVPGEGVRWDLVAVRYGDVGSQILYQHAALQHQFVGSESEARAFCRAFNEDLLAGPDLLRD